MNIELIYDSDCPNVPLARERLVNALKQVDAPLEWTEWERSDSTAPSYVYRYASPTILIDSIDVGGDTSLLDGQEGCRLYGGPEGSIEGAPSLNSILAAFPSSIISPLATAKSRASVFASLGAIAVAALPVGTCPACLPAYAGILSALGLGFAFDGTWSLVTLAVLLIIGLFTLAWRANRRNGYKPFLFGLVASLLIILGKTNIDAEPILYAGSGLLLIVCIWNIWPRKKPLEKRACCQ